MSHLTTDEEDAEGLEQRCHPLHEPTSGQVQSSPAQVTEPEALGQTHDFVPWTRILKPVLVRENRCKTLSQVPLMPRASRSALGRPGAALPVWETPASVPVAAFASMSLSHPLSLTHTSNTCAHKQVDTQGKVTFPVLLRQHDSYFRVVTCSAERRGRCKADAKSRLKLQQMTFFLFL